MNVLINVDHGVFPAGSIAIKEALGINNTEYGLLGSVVFFGLTIGSVAATFLYATVNTKHVLIAVMFLNGCSLLMFVMTNQYILLLLSRFLTGFFQVFVSIYFPVWSDMFGATDSQKQLWLTVLLLSSTLGVLFGYIMTTQFIEKAAWQYSFYTQIIAVIPIILALLFTPIKYLDLKLAAMIKAGYSPEE